MNVYCQQFTIKLGRVKLKNDTNSIDFQVTFGDWLGGYG